MLSEVSDSYPKSQALYSRLRHAEDQGGVGDAPSGPLTDNLDHEVRSRKLISTSVLYQEQRLDMIALPKASHAHRLTGHEPSDRLRGSLLSLPVLVSE